MERSPSAQSCNPSVTLLDEPSTAQKPDPTTRTGRRDHALLTMTVQTGLRVSEICALTIDDVHLGTSPHRTCTGRGRRQSITPLTGATVSVIATYLSERAARPGTTLSVAPTDWPCPAMPLSIALPPTSPLQRPPAQA